MEADGSLEASSYSSGFASKVYPGRSVPDVCGLVGMSSPNPQPPGAMYIMLPVESNARIDLQNAGNNHYRSPGAKAPWGDETTPSDGWAVFSGTSAAAPQLAGVCALIKQACGPTYSGPGAMHPEDDRQGRNSRQLPSAYGGKPRRIRSRSRHRPWSCRRVSRGCGRPHSVLNLLRAGC